MVPRAVGFTIVWPEGVIFGSRPGPHLDQNVLARYAAVAPASFLDPSGGLFFCRRKALLAARSLL